MARDSESIPFSAWKALTPSYTGSGTRVFRSFLNSVRGRAMSGHLLGLFWDLGEHIRPQKHQVHEPRFWDSIPPPFGNRGRFHLAHTGNLRGSTEPVDNCVCIHSDSLGAPNARSQGAPNLLLLGLPT